MSKINRVVLGRPEQRRLEDWVEGNWDDIVAGHATQEATAARAAADLELPQIKSTHVQAAVKALGRKWPVRFVSTRQGFAMVDELRSQLDQAMADLGFVAAMVIEVDAFKPSLSERDVGRLKDISMRARAGTTEEPAP